MSSEANIELAQQADRHLWGHFSSLGRSVDGMPIIERGEGCYVWDNHGNRFLDGLAGLYTTQAGYGRVELARAAGAQAEKLGFFPIWTYAHPKAVELAARLAELTPGDLNRVFFTSGGSEAVESAWKLARQYFKLKGEPLRTKVISRDLSYHGTTMGALSITGLAAVKGPFEPLISGAIKVPNTNSYRLPPWATDESYFAEEIEQAILREGPETIAAVFLEPVQNAGGCFTPPEGYFQRVREICDTHGVLLVSDEVICAYGRLGHWFGSARLGYQPDIITSAKGLTSGYAPLGAMLVSDKIAEPFADTDEQFLHGYTFAGHPVSCAVALANLDLFVADDLLGNVLTNEDAFRASLDDLTDLPIVGDVRGMGYFYGIELVKDRDTKETFTAEESHHLLRSFLTNRMAELGLICRADSRGEPVIQLAPPLIAGPDEFEVINSVLRRAFTEAMAEMEKL